MIQILNGAAAAWGEPILLTAIQNTVFLALVLGALHLLRGAPARVKYLVAMAGLIKLLLPPFMRMPAIVSIPGASGAGQGGLIPFIAGTAGGAAPAAAAEGVSPGGAILGIWAIIALAGLLLSVAGSVRLAVRLRGAEPVADEEIPTIRGMEKVRVLRSGSIAMPITVAFLPGRIYVPSAWDGWTPSCRRMVLRHEMSHLKRRDGLVLIMQIIARAIYFFHPLVLMLDRRLSEYREMACDDETVGWDRDSSVEYSRYLVEIAESVVRCPAVCGSASALIRRKNELLARVSYQLEEGRMRSISKTRVTMLTAAVVLLAVSLSWYRGEASAGDGHPEPPLPPKPPAQAVSGSIRPINVRLKGDGARIDDRPVDLDELVAALDVFGAKDPENVLINLACDDDVPMSDIRILQETLVEMGISKINYVKSDGDGLPLNLPPRKAIERLEQLPGSLIIDVAMTAGGGIIVGAREVGAADLSDVIVDRLAEVPEGIVVIHSEEMSYGDFTKVLELAKKAGAERIVVKFDGGG